MRERPSGRDKGGKGVGDTCTRRKRTVDRGVEKLQTRVKRKTKLSRSED